MVGEFSDMLDDVMKRLSNVCAKCGQKADDLRPWPPDSSDTLKHYCATCRVRLAVEGASAK